MPEVMFRKGENCCTECVGDHTDPPEDQVRHPAGHVKVVFSLPPKP